MRWIGAFAAWADSTMRMMRASVVSAPIAVVRTVSAPSALMAPPVTLSPTPLATGRLSPVMSDSSMWLRPSTMSPSTATRSPGRTMTRSPTTTCSTGTSSSTSPRRTRAVVGRSAFSARIASAVCRFARCSSHLPKQHQRDDGRRGLEVQVRHAMCGMLEEQVDRQSIGRRGAQRHQPGPCCRSLRARPSSRRGRSASRARTAPGSPAPAGASRPASSRCRRAAAASAGPAAASRQPLTATGHQAGKRGAVCDFAS